MERRDFLRVLAAGGAATALPSSIFLSNCKTRIRQPNVILILTDDQGYGDLGCHGNDRLRTPSLDRLYRESVRFTNFYTCALCSPTRASLLTGRYNYRTGVVDTWVGQALMRTEEVTIAEFLRDAGYRTGIFGKWHLGDNFPLRSLDQGFEESLVHNDGLIGSISDPADNHYDDPVLQHNGRPKKYKGYCTDIFFDAALDFISSDRDRPFFVYLATNVPHYPLEIADSYADPYREMGFDEKTSRTYGMIANLDENIGRLLDRLEEWGLEDDTVVIFMSDNGPQHGDRYNAGLRDIKGSMYDGGIKVPFFVRWPRRLAAGRDVDRIAAHIDVLPTLLEIGGVSIPANIGLDGRSLVPILQEAGGADWLERMLFFQQCRPDPDGVDRPRLFTHCAVRSQRYKIVMTAADPAEQETRVIGFEETQLFDMAADPEEQNDIARQHPDIVRDMRAAYEDWFEDVTSGIRSPVRIPLGDPNANPTTLTTQDICGPGAPQLPFSWSGARRLLAGELRGTGYWNVEVVRRGTYELAYRLGPEEAEWIPSLKPGCAQFRLGPAEFETAIPPDATEVRFRLELEAGPGKLEATLTGQRKDGQKVSPFFIDIFYLENAVQGR
jgi:arylsulfatase A-like enzyme